MQIANTEQFTGFSQQTLDFFKNILENNNKPWFEKNKSNYQKFVITPFKNLVSDLGEMMLDIDPMFEIKPAVNKTISRIYRDTRFSKDKSLFRGNMWLTFKQPSKDWKVGPAFFFELFPDWYRFGMGFYQASRQTMDNFRSEIDENPGEFLEVISFARNNNFYTLHADKYKRLIENSHPEEFQDWYQSKSFYLSSDRGIDDIIFSPKLVEELIFGFIMLKPLYQFLMRVHVK